jgi:PBP1b-binding outer membrane lipoprotein LpoB
MASAAARHKTMLEQTLKRAALVLLICLLLPSCSNLTQSGRQQAAYAKYIKKQSHNRVRQQAKFKKTKAPTMLPSDPKISASAGEGGPQAVPSGQSQEQ